MAAGAAPPSPTVVALHGHLELDCAIEVEVAGLADWARGNDVRTLVPFIDGQPIRGNDPLGMDLERGLLLFHLRITPESEPAWRFLLGAPEGLSRPVTFSVGPGDGSPFASVHDRNARVPLTVISPSYGAIALLVVSLTFVVLLWLSRTTGIIRHPGPHTLATRMRPYDLGRFQMAFWFFLVYASYTTIWLITDAVDTITPSLLALMGISAGTALGEAMIDANRDGHRDARVEALHAERQALVPAAGDPARTRSLHGQTAHAAPDPGAGQEQGLNDRVRLSQIDMQLRALDRPAAVQVSRGFLCDLLSDAGGYRFDRFQIFAFTLILGVIFVSAVYNSLSMPEFSPTLLALMGLSSGTYIGFKLPGQR